MFIFCLCSVFMIQCGSVLVCASQFGLATVKCPIAIQEKPNNWKQNTQPIVWDWVFKFKFILKYFSKIETSRYIRISVISLIWKSSTRYQREICKDQDRYVYNNIKRATNYNVMALETRRAIVPNLLLYLLTNLKEQPLSTQTQKVSICFNRKVSQSSARELCQLVWMLGDNVLLRSLLKTHDSLQSWGSIYRGE